MRLFAFFLFALPLAAGPLEQFETEVRPLLAEKCFACHTQSKMGGLAMTSREALLEGGNSGPAVEPRMPERSLLIQAVSGKHERLEMPPTDPLSEEEIAILVRWVDEGAVWPDAPAEAAAEPGEITAEQRSFWAFQPVKKPRVAGEGSPIDSLIQAQLDAEGLEAAPPADKRTLLRRVYFDLIGLPPTPEEMEAFLADDSPDAFERVVDRLLASPRYGERWGRHWLDVARYSDDRLNSTMDEPFPNAFRYRDWVIEAFNRDMPYDLFVKAQIAADLLPEEETGEWTRDELAGGLGLYGLSPKFQDDRVDVTTRGFLALTVACAQCHDHKFDPIPTEDYYALLGVFDNTKVDERPLADLDRVADYKAKKKAADEAQAELDDYLAAQAKLLVDVFAARTADYLEAAWAVGAGEPLGAKASEAGLDAETLERWTAYLEGEPKNHPLLDGWQELREAEADAAAVRAYAEEIETLLLDVIAEKKRIDEENKIRLGGENSARKANRVELLSLGRDEYFLWKDIASPAGRELPEEASTGVLYYSGDTVERFLTGGWLAHARALRARAEKLEAEVPEKYPFEHVISEVEEPVNGHVHIRGNKDNLGAEVPRRFLTVLADGEPEPFETDGSGRLELARAIASPENPLTARVIANRVWLHHFGGAIVGSPSNFGMMGERPVNPPLLDYLAGRLVELDWSLKALHREIVLTDAYARSSERLAANERIDPENRYFWRANRQRLDVESLRDALLYVTGDLCTDAGGPPDLISDADNRRRTVYSWVSRRSLDPRLGLFDFPNPNLTSEKRVETNTPLQGLFFLNSDLVIQQADALVARLQEEPGAEERITAAYRLLFGREPTAEELRLNREFVAANPEDGWPRLAQVWLASNEFLYVE